MEPELLEVEWVNGLSVPVTELATLIKQDEEFSFATARKVFTADALQLPWDLLGVDKVAEEIAHTVSTRVSVVRAWPCDCRRCLLADRSK